MLIHSPIESKRFDLNIFRSTVDDLNVPLLANEIKSNKVDILILRMPCDKKPIQSQLAALPYKILHCDNLVYYQTLFSDDYKTLRNEIKLVEVDNHNLEELKQLIPAIFKDYQNHYYSNPFLAKERITEGYAEWGQSYINTVAGRESWIVYEDQTAVAYGSCAYDDDQKTCEGILIGVHPDYQGRSIYKDFFRSIYNHYKSKGFKKMMISTQIQNYVVQNIWIKEGLTISHAFDTYHINSFLSHPERVQNSL